MIAEGRIDVNPMEGIPKPIARRDQIRPFSDDELIRLLRAARKSKYPRRDVAILSLLIDTGLRASELCGLTPGDLDLKSRSLRVLGKGGKYRTAYYSQETVRSLQQFLKSLPENWEDRDPLFPSENGGFMSRDGLRQLVARLGLRAEMRGIRVSPHSFRHTFAIGFVRSGGNLFALQQLLGHTDLTMTRRYCAIAQTDVEREALQHSLVDRLTRRERR
jgi:integrase/recombinase XerD